MLKLLKTIVHSCFPDHFTGLLYLQLYGLGKQKLCFHIQESKRSKIRSVDKRGVVRCTEHVNLAVRDSIAGVIHWLREINYLRAWLGSTHGTGSSNKSFICTTMALQIILVYGAFSKGFFPHCSRFATLSIGHACNLAFRCCYIGAFPLVLSERIVLYEICGGIDWRHAAPSLLFLGNP